MRKALRDGRPGINPHRIWPCGATPAVRELAAQLEELRERLLSGNTLPTIVRVPLGNLQLKAESLSRSGSGNPFSSATHRYTDLH